MNRHSSSATSIEEAEVLVRALQRRALEILYRCLKDLQARTGSEAPEGLDKVFQDLAEDLEENATTEPGPEKEAPDESEDALHQYLVRLKEKEFVGQGEACLLSHLRQEQVVEATDGFLEAYWTDITSVIRFYYYKKLPPRARNRYDPDEICNEVYDRLHRYLSGSSGGIPGILWYPNWYWLRRAAIHKMFDFFRSQRRWEDNPRIGDLPVEGEADRPTIETISDATGQAEGEYEEDERKYELRDAWRQIEPALDKLKPMERDIMIAHVIRGMSHREIAAYIEVAGATVRNRLSRARKKVIGHWLLRLDLSEEERNLAQDYYAAPKAISRMLERYCDRYPKTVREAIAKGAGVEASVAAAVYEHLTQGAPLKDALQRGLALQASESAGHAEEQEESMRQQVKRLEQQVKDAFKQRLDELGQRADPRRGSLD